MMWQHSFGYGYNNKKIMLKLLNDGGHSEKRTKLKTEGKHFLLC